MSISLDIMSDSDALLYIQHVERVELPEPDDEYLFLSKHGVASEVFSDVYCAFAARMANDWCDRKKDGIVRLGAAVRAANVGLMLAVHRYQEGGSTNQPRFKVFARPLIQAELDSLDGVRP
jgi:hypothetical protein